MMCVVSGIYVTGLVVVAVKRVKRRRNVEVMYVL